MYSFVWKRLKYILDTVRRIYLRRTIVMSPIITGHPSLLSVKEYTKLNMYLNIFSLIFIFYMNIFYFVLSLFIFFLFLSLLYHILSFSTSLSFFHFLYLTIPCHFCLSLLSHFLFFQLSLNFSLTLCFFSLFCYYSHPAFLTHSLSLLLYPDSSLSPFSLFPIFSILSFSI